MKKQLELTKQIAEAVREAGGRALIVGGYARDSVMRELGWQIESKDIDVEVYGVTKEKLEQVLSKLGVIEETGKQFEVFKVRGHEFTSDDSSVDVSLPRREQQVGPKHQDVKTEYDPDMSFDQAFARRDFTINALGLDPLTGEVIDVMNGVNDIKKKTIRMIDRERYVEDPLRPLRAAQFAARFGFKINQATVEVSRTVDMAHLPPARIGAEWLKLLVWSPKPSIGLKAAQEMYVLRQLHPELEAIYSTKLLKEIDRAANLCDKLSLSEKENMMLAVLVKDLPEPRNFLKQLEINKARINLITKLVNERNFLQEFSEFSSVDLQRLSYRLSPASIAELICLITVEGGKTKKLEDRAFALKILKKPPERILEGRHLVDMGMKQSPEIGKIVENIYQAQLNGEINNLKEAKELVKQFYGKADRTTSKTKPTQK
ncbi:MAG: hypothetical protein ABIG32_02810 [Candidatus Uhrbacteria bacterium]|nr:hypothetical protein [Patescibacteria group bacterium]MBU1906787.1 hypothetical protein [Patescibacteria group bacterium]